MDYGEHTPYEKKDALIRPLMTPGALICSGMPDFLIKAIDWHPWPGLFIAALGFLGVLVPLVRDLSKMGRREKAAWTVLMFVLLVLDVRSLKLASAEVEKDRKDQNDRFNDIATGLKAAIDNDQRQFAATMAAMKGLVILGDESIKNITGGDSFCYLTITNVGTPIVSHVGRYQLSGVQIRIVDIIRFKRLAELNQLSPRSTADVILEPGALAVGQAWIDQAIRIQFSNPDKADFNIFFTARNGTWDELLRMRRINGQWEQAIRVDVEVRPKDDTGRITYKKVFEPVSEKFPKSDLSADSDWSNEKDRAHQAK